MKKACARDISSIIYQYHSNEETTMNSKRNALARLIAATVLALGAGAATANDAYPSRPVKLIVPFAPGGSTDVLARIFAQKLTESSGQPFVVDNRPGAGGNLGMVALAKSAPDGYTIGMTITSHAISMSMPTKPGYDVMKDVVPVRLLTMSTNVLVVNPSVPAKSVKELIELGKSKRMLLNFASSGNGTTPHLSGELFKNMAGIEMQHVPYKGAGPAMSDVIGGNIQLMFDAVASASPYIKSGKVRAIAVTSATRSPQLPDVPTIAEAGLPGYAIDGWLGIVAPAGTSPEVIDWLSRNLNKAFENPEVKEKVKSYGLEYANMPPEKFKTFIGAEVTKWRKIVTQTKAEID
jgi:tripartite-type tricarboxylate transporter receptor subunit TctC